jgi:hypothetical protein
MVTITSLFPISLPITAAMLALPFIQLKSAWSKAGTTSFYKNGRSGNEKDENRWSLTAKSPGGEELVHLGECAFLG